MHLLPPKIWSQKSMLQRSQTLKKEEKHLQNLPYLMDSLTRQSHRQRATRSCPILNRLPPSITGWQHNANKAGPMTVRLVRETLKRERAYVKHILEGCDYPRETPIPVERYSRLLKKYNSKKFFTIVKYRSLWYKSFFHGTIVFSIVNQNSIVSGIVLYLFSKYYSFFHSTIVFP